MKVLFAVAVADVHRRNQKPPCRKDKDFMMTQDKKLIKIANICRENDVPLLIAGDLFDTWKCGHDVVTSTMGILKGVRILTCFGQHELPSHDMYEAGRSPLTTLLISNGMPALFNTKTTFVNVNIVNWGKKPSIIKVNPKAISVLLIHKTVYLGKSPFPDAKGDVKKLIKNPKYSDYDLVVSGDNHISFKYRRGKTLWLNCGCVFRTRSSEKDNKPVCWKLYYETETKKVTACAITLSPLGDNYRKVVTDEHLESEKQEEEWDSDFAKSLTKRKGERPTSFVESVKRELVQSKRSDDVKKQTYDFLEI